MVFSSNCQFHLLWKLFLFNRVDIIINFVDMELSCGLWMLFYFKLSISEERSQSENKVANKAEGTEGMGQRESSYESIRGPDQLQPNAELDTANNTRVAESGQEETASPCGGTTADVEMVYGPDLPICDQSSVLVVLVYFRIFVVAVSGFQFQLFYLFMDTVLVNLVDIIVNPVDTSLSCG
jgi:hypothetical protein